MLKKSLTLAAASTVLLAGVIVSAPAANAALCGYPPVECQTGETNPPSPQRVTPNGSIVLTSQSVADATRTTTPPAPAARNAIGSAPKVGASRGEGVRLSLDLTPGETYRVQVKKGSGPYIFVGTTTAASDGDTVLPTFRFNAKDTYTIALEAANGTVYYVRVVVS